MKVNKINTEWSWSCFRWKHCLLSLDNKVILFAPFTSVIVKTTWLLECNHILFWGTCRTSDAMISLVKDSAVGPNQSDNILFIHRYYLYIIMAECGYQILVTKICLSEMSMSYILTNFNTNNSVLIFTYLSINNRHPLLDNLCTYTILND